MLTMSEHLIMKLGGNKYVNHSFFKPYLYIYDDIMIFKKRRKLFFVDEITMPYNHVAQVNLHRGILFSKFEIIMSGGNNEVHVKGIWNSPAKRAKKLIDNKVYAAHNKSSHPEDGGTAKHIVESVELALSRLRELYLKERINKKEFEKRKTELLKKLHK